MNSYSEQRKRQRLLSVLVSLVLLSAGALLPCLAHALDITAFYVASCQRILGIPIHVNPREVSILTLQGKIEKLPRYEIVYVATYPLDLVPINEISNPEAAAPIRLLTRQDRRMVTLAEGWPVEFSEDRFSFLTTEGRGVVVDRRSIWRLEPLALHSKLAFQRRMTELPEFIHPHIFQTCPLEKDPFAIGKSRASQVSQKIFPQQLLAETVTIKRELDRLMAGHDQMTVYQKKQVFFAVPELYRNETWLALWTSTGSRYGASASRSNNFTPLLRDEFSSGPFSFQRAFITGSGPHPSSVHDEPQTHATYEFKADYFHMELMADLSFILIGSKYRWNIDDSSVSDIRLNDVARIKMGFDRGAFSFGFFPVSTVNAGLYAGGRFREASTSIGRFYGAFRLPEWWLSVDFGSGSGNDTELRFLRINAGREINDATRVLASYISRDYDWLSSSKLEPSINASSQSKTLAFYLEHHYRRRFLLGASAAIEKFSMTAADRDTRAPLAAEDPLYFKAGILAGLIF